MSETTALRALRPEAPGGLAARLERQLVQHRVIGAAAPSLGRYVLRRKRGEGGMAVVFEAFDPQLARAVALKVLRASSSAQQLPDMLHEARALARLSDPAVVTVYDTGVEEGQLYLCMALVDGGDLAAWLCAHPEVGWRRVVSWFAQVARALQAAHQAGVVHRDVKLENLLVGADGELRITDFGLARLDGRDGIVSPALEPRAGWSGRVGTPGYIAPEVLAGGPPTPASDQYAFFVALDRALAFVTDAPPAALAALIGRGAAAEPTARFADLADARAALLGLLGQRDAAGQRAAELLLRRVRTTWIDGVQAQSLAAIGRRLPIVAAPAPELVPQEVHRAALGQEPWPLERVAEALWRWRPGVVLLGAPGSGKTVQLLGIAERLLAHAALDHAAPLPVVLNLSSWAAHRGTFREWLQNELVAKYAIARAQVVAWLDEGRLVALLDGLDELAVERRAELLGALGAFRAQAPLPCVVACRADEYEQLGVRLDCEVALRLSPLGDDALDGLVHAPTDLAAQLRNPLLLSLFLQLGEGERLEPGDLRERLFGASLEHALDAAPRVPAPERAEALGRLRFLAATLERVSVTELWLEEVSWRWLPSRALKVLAGAIALAIAFAGAYLLNVLAAWAGGQPTALGLVWGTASAVSAFAINRGLRVVPMEAMGWSWPRFWKWVPANVAMGVISGIANGAWSGEPVADATLGGITGLLGMSMIGLVPAGRERRVLPGEGLRESLRNALLVAPAVGLLLFVGVGYVAVPLVRPFTAQTSMYHTFQNPSLTWGLMMGVAGGYATLLATGAWAPLAHFVIRGVLALRTRLPGRLEPWLDGWARRGLLRRVGGGWMFRHETLRHWLAAQELTGTRR